MREAKIKKRIVLIALVLLTYPLFEFVTGIQMMGKLSRVDLVSKVEPLNASNWFDGTFQDSFMNYMNDQIGLYPFFVKLHNQLEYTLFGNTHTDNVLTGKENILFEKGYIDAYYGNDFVGLKKIESSSTKLRALQDSLSARGKFMMYIIATSKASYYAESLPYVEEVDSTNYEYVVKSFKEYGVNHIDCSSWFMQMKDTMGHLLFPTYGIHWSHYSSVLVTDSIANYIRGNTGWDLPRLKINKLNYSDKTKFYDNDIAESLNLFEEIQPEPMVYPDFEWENPKKIKKKVLIVGDSFSWDIFEHNRLGTECFDGVEFWFYNQTVHNGLEDDLNLDKGLPNLTRHVNLYETINNYDAFILLSSEASLYKMGWGFVDDALSSIANPNSEPVERNNNYLREQSKRKKTWRKEIEILADSMGVSVDSMISIYLHDRNFNPR